MELSRVDSSNDNHWEMTESEKFDYLQAMSVTQWLPIDFQFETLEILNAEKGDPEASETKHSLDKLDSSVKGNQAGTTIDESNKDSRADLPVFGQYLKLVNWSNRSTDIDRSKKVLIICRHQTDQPANSFAGKSGPSLFMLDYINGLSSLASERGLAVDIQIAHLSQLGLTDDSKTFREGINDAQPDVLFVLGEETVSQISPLSGAEQQLAMSEGIEKNYVASLRGKTLTVESELTAQVSYHPYTLIKEPKLKPLAMEDLVQLVDRLQENT